tara:strand:- start:4688 stop:6025 length:1338 start_codon:yes stop_codon:yes gene_type:complete
MPAARTLLALVSTLWSPRRCMCLAGAKRSALQDGIMDRAARKVLAASNVSLSAVDPSMVWDAPCNVTEPTPPQAHYPLVFVLSTFSARRWMVNSMVRLWLHKYPRLIVSDWGDDDTSGLVGMRWGIGLTWRGLPPVLCLANAMCGRFDWVLFCDDDTFVDMPALTGLLETRLAQASPRLPYFLSFAPQPWPARRDWLPTLHGCPGNCTRRVGCSAPPDYSRPCLGEPMPLTSPARNLDVMWPYGGVGFLLSHRAVDVLRGAREGLDAPATPACGRETRPRDVTGGMATGSMQGHTSEHTLSCLRELTCPWGQLRSCEALPSPFNHTLRRGDPHRPGFCPLSKKGFNVDCRSCGGPDVQFACCLASAGVFVTDLSPLDKRARPSGTGNAYWTPYTATLKFHRRDAEVFEAAVARATTCGLASGPKTWDKVSAETCSARRGHSPKVT